MKIMQKSKLKYWSRLMSKWEQSGQTQEAFCEQEGVKYANFTYWRQKLKDQKCDDNNQENDFIEMKIENETCNNKDALNVCVLHFPNAMRISISSGCSTEDYRQLFIALGIAQ